MVTSDETWVWHYEPESKRQSMECKHAGSPVNKKFKSQQSTRKGMLTVFWDMQGPITISFLEEGSTVNSANYCQVLRQVKKDMKNKRRGHQSKGVFLHHDNARPHTAALTVQTINELSWELLPHPPYSPEVAPSDFHLFGP
ncbi:histone-lysine N-methyltransferase SETMAR [Ixodes scapularis]